MADIQTPNGRRTGALWVAATGAFLLLAAAAVFVAVRWDQLPGAAKLGVVGALTGGFLVAGRATRRTLPATGDVLFHLGALLLPVDLAAVNLRLGASWREMVLAQGVLALGVLGGLGVATDSVVLRWAGIAGGAVLAAGVAATTPVPGPLALAALAVVATYVHPATRRAVVPWAVVAGLAPVLTAAAGTVTRGAGVLAELGFAGDQRVASFASGTLAAWLLGREAARRDDVMLAFTAFASLAVGLSAGWAATAPSADANLVGAAALFAVVELTAGWLRADPFWSRPVRTVAVAAEWLAASPTVVAVAILGAAPLLDAWEDLGTHGDAAVATSLAVLAAGWVIASLRRERTSEWAGVALLCAAVSSVAAVAAGTASTVPTAIALGALAVGLVVASPFVTPAPLTLAVAVCAATWAPVTAFAHPALGLVLGGAGGLALATRGDRRTVAVAALLPVWAGTLVSVGTLDPWVAVTVAVLAAWGVAVVAPEPGAGFVRPLLGLPVLLPVGDLASVAAAVATLAYTVEAVRSDDHRVAFGASVTAQVAVASLCARAGLDVASSGLALTVSALVWFGLAVLVDGRWREPLVVGGTIALAAGAAAAAARPDTLASAAVVGGGLAIAAGLAIREQVVAHLGALVAGAGIAGHLALAGVTASEAYVAPVAAWLVLTGFSARSNDETVSSWVAYGPAVALLGGAAFTERLGGGASWHALVAGAVGVVAVAAGGVRRLAAPLLLGTALVVATAVHESLGAAAGIPTWAWLAAGGSLLLGLGVAMERCDTSPVEAGRRVVDVLSDRFS